MPSRSLGSRERRRGPAVGGEGCGFQRRWRDSRKGVWDRAESRWTRATHQRFVQGSVNPRRESGSEQRTLQSIIPRGSHRADVEAKRPREWSSISVLPRNGARRTLPPNSTLFFFTREWRRFAFPFAATRMRSSSSRELSTLPLLSQRVPSLPSRLRARRLGEKRALPLRVRLRIRADSADGDFVSARSFRAARRFRRRSIFNSFAQPLRLFLAPHAELPVRGDGGALSLEVSGSSASRRSCATAASAQHDANRTTARRQASDRAAALLKRFQPEPPSDFVFFCFFERRRFFVEKKALLQALLLQRRAPAPTGPRRLPSARRGPGRPRPRARARGSRRRRAASGTRGTPERRRRRRRTSPPRSAQAHVHCELRRERSRRRSHRPRAPARWTRSSSQIRRRGFSKLRRRRRRRRRRKKRFRRDGERFGPVRRDGRGGERARPEDAFSKPRPRRRRVARRARVLGRGRRRPRWLGRKGGRGCARGGRARDRLPRADGAPLPRDGPPGRRSRRDGDRNRNRNRDARRRRVPRAPRRAGVLRAFFPRRLRQRHARGLGARRAFRRFWRAPL